MEKERCAAGKPCYKVKFSDRFDGSLSEGSYLIMGGASVPVGMTADGEPSAERTWRFYGDDHIRFARNTVLDTGKFLYGRDSLTDYAFEVKVRADVGGESEGFIPGGELTPVALDSALPFFVTETAFPGATYNKFTGRCVRFTDFAVGFYEYGEDSEGWAGEPVLLKDLFGEFDWRKWHTFRVVASAEKCSFWLDGKLAAVRENAAFVRCPQTAGPCGFSAVCTVSFKPVHFDDFVFYERDFSSAGETLFPEEPSLPPQRVDIVCGARGRVTLNGNAALPSQTFGAHSEVEVRILPKKGYVVDAVAIDGVDMGTENRFTLSNLTSPRKIEVRFTARRKVDVYVLSGQSNAAGYTPVKGLYRAHNYGEKFDAARAASFAKGFPEIMYYGIARTEEPARSGVVWDYVKTGQGTNPQMMGPEIGFAEEMRKYYGGERGKTALVKYAFGSTGFDYRSKSVAGNWSSPSARVRLQAEGLIEEGVRNGLLYDNLVLTFRMAISSLLEEGFEPEVKGMFWLQGCDDAAKEHMAPRYGQNLSDLICDARRDFTSVMAELDVPQDLTSLPFVIGKIAPPLTLAPYRESVLAQMQELSHTLQNVRIAESYDYPLPDAHDNNDGWHFSAKGILALGNRFADVLAQMTGLREKTRYTVAFDSAGGSSVSAQTVVQWMCAEQPLPPEREGYVFLGWYKKGERKKWNFSVRNVREDFTLFARWRKKNRERDMFPFPKK